MTTIALRSSTSSRAGGGLPARRAVVRWSWRLFRREWRQQVMTVALLVFAMGAALFAAIAAYNIAPSSVGRFGTAHYRLTVGSSAPEAMTAELAALGRRYGPIEAIGHTAVPVPGSVERLDFRTQDPNGRFGAPMVAVVSGRAPRASNEIAITDRAGALLRVGVGDRVKLLGVSRTVVGVVENPGDFDDEFVLAPPPTPAAATSVTVLVGGVHPELGTEQWSIHDIRVPDDRITLFAEMAGGGQRNQVALAVLSIDTVAMLLVSLVAAAGFVVVAHRRVRQFGMLAAVGASDRHLRLVMVAHGAAAGLVSAVAATGLSLVSWGLLATTMEGVARHRIDRGDIPWWVFAVGAALAVVTTTAAAWWPARTIARVPITRALSGRPPQPKRSHRSAAAAIVFLAAGFTGLTVAINKSGRGNPLGVIGGTVGIVAGILFLCPLAIRVVGSFAGRVPIAPRLALRDLVRHQARAGAALGAISMALAITFAAISTTAAVEPRSDGGNLSDRQMLVRLGVDDVVPDESADQIRQLDRGVDQLAATLGHATVYRLDAAVGAQPAGGSKQQIDPLGRSGQHVIMVGVRVNHGIEVNGNQIPYIATPSLVAHAGLNGSIDPSAEVITPRTGRLILVDPSEFARGPRGTGLAKRQALRKPGFTDVPQSFITETAMKANGWTRTRAGWFIESNRPLTERQRAAARRYAASAGLTVETRDEQGGLRVARTSAAAAGMLLALGILAMTIGLIRGEATRDLQTLTATGATRSTRRVLTATTSGALALAGVVVGLFGAYVGLVAGFLDDLDPLRRVPVTHLVVVIVGLPVVAAISGWLLGGREPPAINRQALE